ncbi:MAG: arylesterase, partial [Alphaproteobacteria bacterium]|nr:arylesterase [Alphaproteobacteria bacterium]
MSRSPFVYARWRDTLVLFLAVSMLVVQPFAKSLADHPITITMLGDSITAGFGLGPRDALPAKLQLSLHEGLGNHAVRIINAGISGDTTAGGLARIDWALSDNSDYVFIALGGNDGLRGLSPASTRSNLVGIVERVLDAGKKPVLFGMLAPPNLGTAYTEEFNSNYPQIAAQYAIPLYPFLLEGVAAVRSL